jgi:hypothetical protein
MDWRKGLLTLCGPGVLSGVLLRDWVRLLRKDGLAGSVPEFGLPSNLHLSAVPVIDLLQATLQPLRCRQPVALHSANGPRHSGFASHDFIALMRRRIRALQIETQLGVLGPSRFDEARIALGDGSQPAAQQRLFEAIKAGKTDGGGDDQPFAGPIMQGNVRGRTRHRPANPVRLSPIPPVEFGERIGNSDCSYAMGRASRT